MKEIKPKEKQYSYTKSIFKSFKRNILICISLFIIPLSLIYFTPFNSNILSSIMFFASIVGTIFFSLYYFEEKSEIKKLNKKYKNTTMYDIVNILFDRKYNIPNRKKISRNNPYLKENIGNTGYVEYHYSNNRENDQNNLINIAFFNNKQEKALFVLQYSIPAKPGKVFFYQIASDNQLLKENTEFLDDVKSFLLNQEIKENNIIENNKKNDLINSIINKCNYIEDKKYTNSSISNLKNNIFDFIQLKNLLIEEEIELLHDKLFPNINKTLEEFLLLNRLKDNKKAKEAIIKIENIINKYSDFLKETINTKAILNIEQKLNKTEINLKIEEITQ